MGFPNRVASWRTTLSEHHRQRQLNFSKVLPGAAPRTPFLQGLSPSQLQLSVSQNLAISQEQLTPEPLQGSRGAAFQSLLLSPPTPQHSFLHKRWNTIDIHPCQAIYILQTVKNPPAMKETQFISGWGRSPGEGNGNPLQYSCLDNSMDRGAWWATVHGAVKSWTWLSPHFILLKLLLIKASSLQLYPVILSSDLYGT